MAPNITTDDEAIAKRIASVCYGYSPTGPGSRYNPEAKTDNCVFVSLAFLLGTTAPKLSSLVEIDQPEDNSGGMKKEAILDLLKSTKKLGMVKRYVLSDTAFDYGSDRAHSIAGANGNLVLYYPYGGQNGHCIVGKGAQTDGFGILRPFIFDYQHCGAYLPGPDFTFNVSAKTFPNGAQDTSLDCTIWVETMGWREGEIRARKKNMKRAGISWK